MDHGDQDLPQQQEVEQTKPSFISKVLELKASAQTNLQRIKVLLTGDEVVGPSPKTDETAEVEPHLMLEELAKDQGISPSDYLSKSRRALENSTRLQQRINVERQTLQDSIYMKSKDLVIQRIKALDETRGLRRITTVLEKSRLSRQKAAIDKEVGALKAQAEAKRDQITKLQEEEQPIRQKQEALMLEEICKAVQSVKDGYEQLLQDILKDGTMPSEIISLYIQRVIAPKVDEAITFWKLPDSKRDEFYMVLQEYVDHRNGQEQEVKPYKEKLDHFIANEQGFHDMGDVCRIIVDGDDGQVVGGFVATMAAEDIIPIRTVVQAYFQDRGHESNERFSSAFQLAIATEGLDRWNRRPVTFGDRVYAALSPDDSEYRPNMSFWQVVRDSPLTNEVFGEIIRKRDQKYYESVLDKSLSDTEGGDINLLRYYPTPDSIRNLVLLASADHRNYRTVHANWSLSDLAKRPDWKEILDEAEKTYPSLKNARQVLESWSYNEYSNQPDIKEAAGDFVLGIFESKPDDQRLLELATESLTNASLLTILARRDVLSEEEMTNLKEADALIKQVTMDTWKKYRDGDKSISLISDYSFTNGLRKNLFLLLDQKVGTVDQQIIAEIKKFELLSQAILENKTNYLALDYITQGYVIERVTDPSFDIDLLPVFLSAYQVCPLLLTNHNLLDEFCKQFEGEDTVTFFRDMSVAYQNQEEKLYPIVVLVGAKEITQERALELPNKASDIFFGELFLLATEFPKIYLTTDQDCEFLRKMSASYQKHFSNIKEISGFLANNNISRELALIFPQQATALMDDKMRETRIFIFQHGDTLLRDVSDIRFMNNLVGEFGKKSDQLIRGYHECLKASAISTADKELVLEFARQFRVISPTTLKGYKEAKEAGHEKVYIAQLQSLAERMTGSGKITDEEKTRPYYKDLLRHVYSNNCGHWTSFESNDSCLDRSGDIAGFKIQPRYEIDLLSQSEIRVKSGETLDATVKEDVQKPILEVAERMNDLGNDKEKIQAALQESVDKALQEILQKGGLSGVNLESVTTLDEKLFLVLTDSIYGSKSVDSKTIKNLIITYEFTTFEDISDYIAGTSDRVGRANNQDYALFCEVGAFYSDRIKEVNRRLVQAAWNNPTIAAAMPNYFQRLAQDATTAQQKDLINRLQVDRLAASESFVRQVGRILEKRRGKKYTPDEVRTIIRRYEISTGGLTEKASTSQKEETRAFYGQLRSQRERTFEALRAITGQEVDPKETHLGEINLQQILAIEASMREGKYDEEQFASYTVQRFIDLFEDERIKIDGELSKFESLSGKHREVVYGYIIKSKESAHARMVGGVCVAGDNPDKYPKENMWNMPNYFQMVFQEPDTLQCQGLVLLHHFNEGGKKVLAASFNPSSTYLYSVDEAALFNGITSSLEKFASENGFDIIAVSNNKTIRTNRTGGEFETAMNKRIASIGKIFKFINTQRFSYHPNYQIQEMDTIWERNTT